GSTARHGTPLARVAVRVHRRTREDQERRRKRSKEERASPRAPAQGGVDDRGGHDGHGWENRQDVRRQLRSRHGEKGRRGHDPGEQERRRLLAQPADRAGETGGPPHDREPEDGRPGKEPARANDEVVVPWPLAMMNRRREPRQVLVDEEVLREL